jgi:hypothetical protein
MNKTPSITSHPLYGVWENMKSRCYNYNMTGYVSCGGKGIIVCEEWIYSPMTFINWALSNGYEKGMILHRKDTDGNYEPNNCEFITREIWQRRKR